MRRLLLVIIAAWAGGLWTICGIVAPLLFRVLQDRSLAGSIAGHMFTAATWLALVLGALTFLVQMRVQGKTGHLNRALALVGMLAPALSEFGLRPLMESARATGNMGQFGMLHGLSALLFGVACLATALLLWRTAGTDAVSTTHGG